MKISSQQAAILELERRRRLSSSIPKKEKSEDLLTWTRRVRPFLIPGRPFDTDRHSFLIEPYLTCSSAPSVVFMKSAQVGVSELMLSDALYGCESLDATTLYVFPTDSHVSDFSTARLSPAIEASPHLQKLLSGSTDRVTLKRIGKRFLYFRGAAIKPDGGSPGLKSIDADRIFLDELDEYDPRALDIARKRLGHSVISHERMASTPTYPNLGIHSVWQNSDMRYWHIRCHHCGEQQPLTLQSFVTEFDDLSRPVSWYGIEDGAADAHCRRCHLRIDRLSSGVWIPERTAPHLSVGFHFTKLFSPFTDPLSIILSLQTTNQERIRQIYNQDLGIPFLPVGIGLTDAVIESAKRGYYHGTKTGPCFMGIDVGKVLHTVVRHADGSQLFAGETSWENVDALINRFQPERVVIDALPEISQVAAIKSRHAKNLIYSCTFVQTNSTPVINAVDSTISINRTIAIDDFFAAFREGRLTLPADINKVLDYTEHLKAPVRTIVKSGEKDVARYVETGPDHYALAETYAFLATQIQRKPQEVSVGAQRRILSLTTISPTSVSPKTVLPSPVYSR